MKTIESKLFRTLATTFCLLALTLGALPASGAEGSSRGVVNINEAKVEQLTLLPRVGPALAGRIVEHREQNGKFKAAEDLILVRGIGEKTFRLLEPFVALSGKTTLETKVRASELDRAQEADQAEASEAKP